MELEPQISNHLADLNLVFVTADEIETLALPRTVVQSVCAGTYQEHSTRWGVPPPVEDSTRLTVHSNACIDIINEFIRDLGRDSDIVGRFGRTREFQPATPDRTTLHRN